MRDPNVNKSVCVCVDGMYLKLFSSTHDAFNYLHLHVMVMTAIADLEHRKLWPVLQVNDADIYSSLKGKCF